MFQKLSHYFNHVCTTLGNVPVLKGRPHAQFLTDRVKRLLMLTAVEPGRSYSFVENDKWGGSVDYTASLSADDIHMEVNCTIHYEGKDYKTCVIAEKLASDPSICEIKSIIFDNEAQKLDSSKEIYRVLNWIWNNYGHQSGASLQMGARQPHMASDAGRALFSNFGRFKTRHTSF